ncbi:vacuolar membrane protein-domain-containing protein [Ochromonadaceae sp. CCMP2298]|nr:vacuolar membrane protein-domain-containing protein [Ochromonadaceae sp. CCMP2298]
MVEKCRLLGGAFASIVQGILGFICISALVIKRENEVPRRDWYVWFLDVNKQGIGASFGHFANIFLSVAIAEQLVDADECQWYCVTYVTDSTLGTLLNIAFLRLFESQVQKYPHCTSMRVGDYGQPPRLSVWGAQLSVWLAIVILSKIITLGLLYLVGTPANLLVSYVFSVFRDHPQLELLCVMIVIPTILNTLQFWVTDTYLKKRKETVDENDLDRGLISGTTRRVGESRDENRELGIEAFARPMATGTAGVISSRTRVPSRRGYVRIAGDAADSDSLLEEEGGKLKGATSTYTELDTKPIKSTPPSWFVGLWAGGAGGAGGESVGRSWETLSKVGTKDSTEDLIEGAEEAEAEGGRPPEKRMVRKDSARAGREDDRKTKTPTTISPTSGKRPKISPYDDDAYL